MKSPTPASLKKVNVENLARLGVERLAEILVATAAVRPELKRRLRMELAAEQGADHLAFEIDKRLVALETSRSKVSWRQRATFVRDLDALRVLIATRLAELDAGAALDRMWLFMGSARRVGSRVRDRDGELAAVFDRAAHDIGPLLSTGDEARQASALVEAITQNPTAWGDWLPSVLTVCSPSLSEAALRRLAERCDAVVGWVGLVRQLADAAGNVDAFRATFSADALLTPANAAEVAQRLLAADRVEEAGAILGGANSQVTSAKALGRQVRSGPPDFAWETVWIDYLERTGDLSGAQDVRWVSFERTLSAERAKAFTRRLSDFQDVEAEERAFDHATAHPDTQLALRFLFDWPALPQAARLIETRGDDLRPDADQAEMWAARLASRYPAAANLLLRKAAAIAFRRRDFATSERLTQEADALDI
ncbi:MAG: hypothetical protein JWO33_507 [Caulobacteraceae bacterium]|nr:hypothetical protein [Caulobacteraceae bacterium]